MANPFYELNSESSVSWTSGENVLKEASECNLS